MICKTCIQRSYIVDTMSQGTKFGQIHCKKRAAAPTPTVNSLSDTEAETCDLLQVHQTPAGIAKQLQNNLRIPRRLLNPLAKLQKLQCLDLYDPIPVQ